MQVLSPGFEISDSPYHNPCEEKNINIPAERTRFYGKLKNFSA